MDLSGRLSGQDRNTAPHTLQEAVHSRAEAQRHNLPHVQTDTTRAHVECSGDDMPKLAVVDDTALTI
jgi:hypothetical protein